MKNLYFIYFIFLVALVGFSYLPQKSITTTKINNDYNNKIEKTTAELEKEKQHQAFLKNTVASLYLY